MPKKSNNQQQSINDLLFDILSDEAQIIRCLRVFFCDTLQDISRKYYECPERKVKLTQDLITAAAQKEAALAAVLEAISKFEEEQDEFITLVPGASFQVTSSSPTVQNITFEAKTDPSVTGGIISGMVDGVEYGSATEIDEIPAMRIVNLGGNYPPSHVTLQNTGTVTVYIRNVVAS